MKTLTQFGLTTTQVLIGAILAVASIAIIHPYQAHAATYAFVNGSGEVSIVSADNPMAALANALNIDIHSGVMLLSSQIDAIVGSHVSL